MAARPKQAVGDGRASPRQRTLSTSTSTSPSSKSQPQPPVSIEHKTGTARIAELIVLINDHSETTATHIHTSSRIDVSPNTPTPVELHLQQCHESARETSNEHRQAAVNPVASKRPEISDLLNSIVASSSMKMKMFLFKTKTKSKSSKFYGMNMNMNMIKHQHHHLNTTKTKTTSPSLLCLLIATTTLLIASSIQTRSNGSPALLVSASPQQASNSTTATATINGNDHLHQLNNKQTLELLRGASNVELTRTSSLRAQRDTPLGSTCGYPGSPAHASVTFNTSSIATGTSATYTCDNGYELLGPPRRSCQPNGTWSPVGIPFCVLNVGLGKAAMQSSTAGQGSAQKAVDGSTSPYFQASTCTMTDVETSPWWYVNLLEPYLVQIVRIDFGMACCANRQKATIAVRVGNNRPDLGNNPVCNRYQGFIEEGKPLFLPCTRPAPGAFVSIHLESPTGSPLSICETFIYTDHALSIEQCPSFRDQPLGSTATYNGKCYLFHNNQALPFEGARKHCESRGGSLVDETSPALQGFLSWELYRRHRNDQLLGQYWLGATRDPRNGQLWRWLNGREVQVSFWSSVGAGGNCSRFDGSKGWLWSDADCATPLNFVCQYRPLSCGKPERPTNSSLATRTHDNGTLIEYQCAPGNLLLGPKSRACLPTGFFSEFAPKCKYLDCQPPAQVPNGELRLHNGTTSYQSLVTYSCREGYQLYGRATLQCDVDERWNGPPPRCEPLLCPAPVPPANGYVTVTANVTTPGTLATFDCRPSYELVGERLLTCSTQGVWDFAFPYCREKRQSILPHNMYTHLPASPATNQQPLAPSLRPAPPPSPTVLFPESARPTTQQAGATSSRPTQSATTTLTSIASPSSSSSIASSTSPAASIAIATATTPTATTTTPTTPTTPTMATSPISIASLNGLAGQFGSSAGDHRGRPSGADGSQTELGVQRAKANGRPLGAAPAGDSHSPLATSNSISVQHQGAAPTTAASAPPSTTTLASSSSSLSPSSSTSSSFGLPTATAGAAATSFMSTIGAHREPDRGHHSHSHNSQHQQAFGSQHIRSQNSLANTRYSLDGIIAVAIFGGFIFLGAIITMIVIIIRRRKSSHSSSIDAQTICTFDSNGNEHNGLYRNYQQAWENLRYATNSGVGANHVGVAAKMATLGPKAGVAASLLQQQQQAQMLLANAANRHSQHITHSHAHPQLQRHSLNLAALEGAIASSQSSSGSGASSQSGSGRHGSHAHLAQAAAARQQHSMRLHHHHHHHHHDEHDHAHHHDDDDEDDLGPCEEQEVVLTADGQLHHTNYPGAQPLQHRHRYNLQHSGVAHHTNEGFRDSNELTVGADQLLHSRPASQQQMANTASGRPSNGRSNYTNSRLSAQSAGSLVAESQLNGASGGSIAGVSAGAISINPTTNTNTTGNNNRRVSSRHGNHNHHAGATTSQHQRLVSSSSGSTPTTSSTRSSRASGRSEEDDDEHDQHSLDRLAYGQNWRQVSAARTPLSATGSGAAAGSGEQQAGSNSAGSSSASSSSQPSESSAMANSQTRLNQMRFN